MYGAGLGARSARVRRGRIVRAIAAARAGDPVQNEDIAALRTGLQDWPRMSIAAGAPYALADHALALAGGGTPTF